MLKVLLVQGANGNYLGKREPAIYGSTTVDELNAMLLAPSRKGFSATFDDGRRRFGARWYNYRLMSEC